MWQTADTVLGIGLFSLTTLVIVAITFRKAKSKADHTYDAVDGEFHDVNDDLKQHPQVQHRAIPQSVRYDSQQQHGPNFDSFISQLIKMRSKAQAVFIFKLVHSVDIKMVGTIQKYANKRLDRYTTAAPRQYNTQTDEFELQTPEDKQETV